MRNESNPLCVREELCVGGIWGWYQYISGFPGSSVVKDPPASAGDVGSTPGSGRSSGEEMARCSSVLAWEITWTEALVGYNPWGHKRVGHDSATKQQQHSWFKMCWFQTYSEVIQLCIYVCVCARAQLLSRVWLFLMPWLAGYQASMSMEFSRQENWTGLPFPTSGDLSNSGIEPKSPALTGWFFTISATQIYMHILFHILSHYGLFQDLNIVLCAHNRTLFVYFMYTHLYLLIPNSYLIPNVLNSKWF